MDSHITGCRGGNARGAVPSKVACGVKFGDTAMAAVEIFRTGGASSGLGEIPSMPAAGKKHPLLIVVHGHILTAFNGTAPVFTLTETNLDDTGSVNIAAIADFTAGKFSLHKVLTTDKKYKLTYTPDTGGTPTSTGEGYFFIEVTGPGLQKR